MSISKNLALTAMTTAFLSSSGAIGARGRGRTWCVHFWVQANQKTQNNNLSGRKSNSYVSDVTAKCHSSSPVSQMKDWEIML